MMRILILLLVFSVTANAVISSGQYTIGTGQTYATISAFEADLATELIGAVTGIINANYNDTAGVTFTGTVNTSTTCIYLTVASAYRHVGKWDGSKSSCTRTGETFFTISGSEFIDIDGLQIALTPNSNDSGIGLTLSTQTATVTIRNCIVRAITPTGTNNFGIRIRGGLNNRIYNNLVYGWNAASNYGIAVDNNIQPLIAYIYNNTVSTCTTGIMKQTTPSITIKNNISVENGDGYSGTWATGSDYNASSIASDLPVTTTQTHSTNTATIAIFTDSANGDYSLVGNDIWVTDKGTDLSADAGCAFNTDILGVARGATWDMGAFEYVGGEPPVSAVKSKTIHIFGDITE